MLEILIQQIGHLEDRHFIEQQMKMAPAARILDYMLDDIERELGSTD